MTDLGDDVRREIEWEQSMVDRGVAKFLDAQREARQNGRGDESSAGSTLVKTYIMPLAEAIEDYMVPKAKERYTSDRQVMQQLGAETLAMITLKSIMSELHNPQHTLPSAAYTIGSRIEEELNLRQFHADYGEYFEEILRRIERKKTGDANYKYQSIVGSFRNQKDVHVQSWTTKQKYTIGQRLVQIALDSCDLFEIDSGRKGSIIRPTQQCLEWIAKHDDAVSLAFPDRMPTIIPPQDWDDARNGGYILPHLRKITPLVIRAPLATLNGDKWLDVYDTEMPKVLRAGNLMQNTAWKINTKVLEVLQEVFRKNLGIALPQSEPYEFPPCPLEKDANPKDLKDGDPMLDKFMMWKSEMRRIHEMEAERKAKLYGAMRTLRMAQMMAQHNEFYYVWRMDFRGRWYAATTGLSPQGADVGKSLLLFRKGKVLGKSGWFEFRVTGANRYGKDKVSFQERAQWIDSCKDQWLAVASDPIRHADIWASADEPYQFLAWCFEYAGALAFPGGPEGYRSYLPCGRDGSCNGLQHFSAMLRDSVGGAAVNLMPGDRPSDIYQRVADVMTDKLRANAVTMGDEHQASRNWITLFNRMGLDGAPRSLSKKPVMTLPYGSTERACCDSIAAWYNEQKMDVFPKATAFKHSLYLTPILWGSIGEVVIAARAAMAWIRKCTSIVVKEGHHLEYTSILGFPVRQVTNKRDTIKIKTYLRGSLSVKIALPNKELDMRKMQNGSAPNFVHHADATHLAMTINAMADEGILDFAFIHDDYGCHAADVATMQRIIREQFVYMYTEYDILQRFKDEVEQRTGVTLPPVPEKGDLNIKQVLQSPFFFS